MIQLRESFTGNELSDYLNLNIVDEGKISDFFKKTYSYLKSQIAKVGNFFVAVFNGNALPAVTPVTSQIGLSKGMCGDSQCAFWMGTSEDAKYSKCATKPDYILSKYPSTIDAWKRAAHVFNESEITMSYDMLLEELKLSAADRNIPNVDGDGFRHEVAKRLRSGGKADPLLVWGAPGVGKTSIINAAMKEVMSEGSRFLDIQLSNKAADDFFLPYYNNDHTEAIDLPKSYIPVYSTARYDEKLKKYVDLTPDELKAADEATGSGLIFFDELSRAKPETLNVCLKLVNERKLGEYHRLGSKWSIICASNRFEDDEESQTILGKALGNRFKQINYAPTYKSWKKWAETKKYMNQFVLDWLEQNEKYFYYQAKEDVDSSIYASPRSWELACKALAEESYTADEEGFDLLALPDDVIKLNIQSCVGLDPANGFLDYVRLIRTVDPIKLKLALTDPDKAPLPKKEGSAYKTSLIYIYVTTILSMVTEMPDAKTFENLCKYFARLGSVSAAGKFFAMITTKFEEMNKHFGEDDGDGFDDLYLPGLKVLIDAYPEWESADF